MRSHLLSVVALVLCCFSLSGQVSSKTVNMTLTVRINVPLPCTLTGGTVEFGELWTADIDNSSHAQPMNYSMDCQGRLNDYLKVRLKGDATTINGEQVLKTDVDGFGLRIQTVDKKTPVIPGDVAGLPFTYTSNIGPALEVIPVKENGLKIASTEFNATATLVVDYQ